MGEYVIYFWGVLKQLLVVFLEVVLGLGNQWPGSNCVAASCPNSLPWTLGVDKTT